MNGLSPGIVAEGWLFSGVGAYALTAAVSGLGELARKPLLKRVGLGLLGLGLALNAGAIASMWVAAGRAPFQSLYQTLFLYALCIAAVSLALTGLHRLSVLTPFVAGGALLCLLYAYRHPDLEYALLPPALQSGWFVPHVVTYFVAYAALFISFVLAALALIQLWRRRGAHAAAAEQGAPPPLAHAAHQAAIFGFVALTLGLAMGAAWGKSAWGEYWSWDPKENWALVTWLAYLCYHHVRKLPAWRESRALWVNIGCFAAAMFTYLGMHLLPTAAESLHVYK